MQLYFRKDERFYHIHLQNNFFGGVTVMCSWGTFDSNRVGYKYIFCDNDKEVEDALNKITKSRISRGYASYSALL